jgi:hypothetical protein
MDEAPENIELTLEEAEFLFVALEDAADLLSRLVQQERLQVYDLVGPLAGIEYQLGLLADKLFATGGGSDAH